MAKFGIGITMREWTSAGVCSNRNKFYGPIAQSTIGLRVLLGGPRN